VEGVTENDWQVAVLAERSPGGCASSTPRSVEGLFRAHYSQLVRALAIVLDDREEAADAVQEAFLQLERCWEKVSAYDDPVSWVRRVALHRLLTRRRSLQRRARALLRMPRREQHLSQESTLAMELREVLGKLPLRQRTAVVLFYYADLPIAEIATTMRISEGAVNQHLHRAREALRRELGVAEW
jgi:RNA polymerase sigma-70 factor (ECF subfamily)